MRPDSLAPVYGLLHSLPETGRVKVVGIFSTRASAEIAEEQARTLPGFLEEPHGFTIEEYEIDKLHWARDFIRL